MVTKEELGRIFRRIKVDRPDFEEVVYNGCKIKINRYPPLSNNERVKEFYRKNPDKAEEVRLKKREIYRGRRSEGICVFCRVNKAKENYVKCEQCLHKYRQK